MNATASVLLACADNSRATWLDAVLATDGFDTARAQSGRETLALVGDLRPKIVLIDTPLADLDGAELCRGLRALTEAPIVVVAPDADEADIVRALELGADEYLLRPLRPRELAARVRALLRRVNGLRAQSEDGRLVFGDLEVGLDEHRVYRQGQLVDLSPIEFRLLECMVRVPGRVVSHRKLLGQVWGADYGGCTHYLRLYIGYLRCKLEDDPRDPKMILNEWGIGYRFEPPADGAR